MIFKFFIIVVIFNICMKCFVLFDINPILVCFVFIVRLMIYFLELFKKIILIVFNFVSFFFYIVISTIVFFLFFYNFFDCIKVGTIRFHSIISYIFFFDNKNCSFVVVWSCSSSRLYIPSYNSK